MSRLRWKSRTARTARSLAVLILAAGAVATAAPAASAAPIVERTSPVFADDDPRSKLPTPRTVNGAAINGYWESQPVSLQLMNSGKCLVVGGSATYAGAHLHQWTCYPGPSAQKWWRWIIMGDSNVQHVYLYNSNSGKCAEVVGWSLAPQAPILQWHCDWSNNQTWVVSGGVFSGYWTYRNYHTGMCMEVDAWRKTNGAAVTQWECTGTATQRWAHRSY